MAKRKAQPSAVADEIHWLRVWLRHFADHCPFCGGTGVIRPISTDGGVPESMPELGPLPKEGAEEPCHFCKDIRPYLDAHPAEPDA